MRRDDCPGASPEESGDPEAGSAIIEFLIVGVCVLVPLAYIVLAAGAVQSAVFASTQAVREAGRAFVTSATAEQGRQRAMAAASLAFDDHGIPMPPGALEVGCADGPCLTPGSTVVVTVDWRVPLPWLPASMAGSLAASAPSLVPVRAEHRIPVDDFRGTPA